AIRTAAGRLLTHAAGALTRSVAVASVRIGLTFSPWVGAFLLPLRIPGGGFFPLFLGRQPFTDPPGVGVGLIPTHTLHRMVRLPGAGLGETDLDPPAPALLPPIQGMFHCIVFSPLPTCRTPA